MPDLAGIDVSTARSSGMDAILRRNFTDRELVEAGQIARAKLREMGLAQAPKVDNPYVYEKDKQRAQQKCVHGFHLDHCGKAAIQNLNGKLDPRIQALFGDKNGSGNKG